MGWRYSSVGLSAGEGRGGRLATRSAPGTRSDRRQDGTVRLRCREAPRRRREAEGGWLFVYGDCGVAERNRRSDSPEEHEARLDRRNRGATAGEPDRSVG